MSEWRNYRYCLFLIMDGAWRLQRFGVLTSPAVAMPCPGRALGAALGTPPAFTGASRKWGPPAKCRQLSLHGQHGLGLLGYGAGGPSRTSTGLLSEKALWWPGAWDIHTDNYKGSTRFKRRDSWLSLPLKAILKEHVWDGEILWLFGKNKQPQHSCQKQVCLK